MKSVVWDNNRQPQCKHIDYLNNMRVLAMAYSLDKSHLLEEVDQHGSAIFDFVYDLSTDSFYLNRRHFTLLMPFIKEHLMRLHTLLLFRPHSIPRSSELGEILLFSWTSYGVGKDLNQAAALVKAVLEVVRALAIGKSNYRTRASERIIIVPAPSRRSSISSPKGR